jgi:hypothetical protein
MPSQKSSAKKTTKSTRPRTKVTPINRKAKQFAEKLPAEFLECRQYRHAWSAHTVQTGKSTYTVTIRCLRCKSLATEVIDQTGQREGNRHINYAEGYLARGLGRMDGTALAAVRLENLHRQIESDGLKNLA